ncbi:MAG: flagellar capping protein [Lachnospiraceae bacterium]|nr:flagellar capping protein [Lachnospiraceae bacterium]
MSYNSIHNLSNVYNFYMTTYAPKSSTPYDSHKKSELRGVYNSIVKLNKESPLYILDTSKDSREFAVSMKENARELRNTIASLGGLDEENLLNKKVAYSSNPDIATADFIGSVQEGEELPTYNIEVNRLATPQINSGNYLADDAPVALPPDTYSFDIGIDGLNYEFQFSIKPNDTNKDVQERLARLITNANIGMKAQVVPGEENTSYLRMESNSTGLKGDNPYLFMISDHRTSKTAGTVEYFGLDHVSTHPGNASYVVNGDEQTSTTNRFTLDRIYEVKLTGVSSEEGETASIGLKTDVESLTENINTLVRGFNSFLKTVAEYTDNQPKSNQLFNEMSGVARVFAHDLTSVGLNLNLDGTLEVDDNTLRQSAMSNDAAETFSPLKSFTNAVLRKSNQVSLNPMNYVNNIIVAYKNPGKNFASPYITSAYSGMMFNSYC